MLGLEQAYEFTRGQIPHETDIAVINAYRLMDLEWQHGFFVEERAERLFLHMGPIMASADVMYIAGHVLVTIAVLLWVYTAHRTQFPYVRNVLMLTTAIALVVFYLYPTAPPRLLSNYGFIDPLQAHNLTAPGGEQPSSYTYNPYAAMPSLHVGYALVSALAVLRCTDRRGLRVLAVLYPILMAFTVIITGNHWVLDVVGAAVTVGVSTGILWLVPRVRPCRRPFTRMSRRPALAASGGETA